MMNKFSRSICAIAPLRGILPPCSNPNKKEKAPTKRLVLFWLRNRDSNPNKQSQSLSCYRYTIPQRLTDKDYYITF